MPISDFERYPLTFGPSPVHRLDRLTAHPERLTDDVALLAVQVC